MNQYETASQRVAATYQRMLCQYCPVLPEGLTAVQQGKMRVAQEDLHAFFKALYDALYNVPEQFGLPTAADSYLVADHSKERPDKTAVKRVLDRQRKPVENGLSFLSSIGRQGIIEDDILVLDADASVLDFIKKLITGHFNK